MSEAAVRAVVVAECAEALAALGYDLDAIPDDLDLRTAGAIDSLGFVELIGALEDRLGVELDFAGLEPERLTVVGPLVGHVAAQVERVRGNGVADVSA
jgi:acyl carrier protein